MSGEAREAPPRERHVPDVELCPRSWETGTRAERGGRRGGCDVRLRSDCGPGRPSAEPLSGLRGRSLAALRRAEQRDRVRLASRGKALTIVHEDD